jgi:hypothetical protein
VSLTPEEKEVVGKFLQEAERLVALAAGRASVSVVAVAAATLAGFSVVEAIRDAPEGAPLLRAMVAMGLRPSAEDVRYQLRDVSRRAGATWVQGAAQLLRSEIDEGLKAGKTSFEEAETLVAALLAEVQQGREQWAAQGRAGGSA